MSAAAATSTDPGGWLLPMTGSCPGLSLIIVIIEEFTGFPVRRSSRRSAGIPQLPLSDRSQYCTVVAEQSGHFCSVQTQMSSSG